ncbi:hypothetical protein LDENG_00180660 [Lucifuga dentata]|nr:hypothetical protein LDENG_00180660 [Lucifuga dentata]
MTRQDKPQIRLFTKKGFYWLIEDRVDTTVTKETSCAYDRIVVSGDTFRKAIKPHSAQVFNYGKTLRVPKDQVLTLSDHLPVLVHLRSSAHLLQATPILILLSTLQSFM